MFINALRNVWNSIRSTFSFSGLYFFRHLSIPKMSSGCFGSESALIIGARLLGKHDGFLARFARTVLLSGQSMSVLAAVWQLRVVGVLFYDRNICTADLAARSTTLPSRDPRIVTFPAPRDPDGVFGRDRFNVIAAHVGTCTLLRRRGFLSQLRANDGEVSKPIRRHGCAPVIAVKRKRETGQRVGAAMGTGELLT